MNSGPKRAWPILFLLAVIGRPSLPAQTQPTPLVHGHAHNDYQHTRPLFDALDCGFCSVEADVHLVDSQLLVAHDRFLCKPGSTLQALYLEPLRELVRKNGGQMLTRFRGDQKETNAITVIITGHRSREMLAGETERYVALDGDLADLKSHDSANLIPWISSNWSQSFKWRGNGPMPEAERLKLKEIVAQADSGGRKVRFWGAPDKPLFWQELLADGVDLINTDDLPGLQKFFAEQK